MSIYSITSALFIPVGNLSYLLVGGYGDEQGRGIETYTFDAGTGELQLLDQSLAIENPSYVCVDANEEFVYAVSESEERSEAHLFSLDGITGRLTYINKESVNGKASCYVSTNKGRNHLFVANYKSGSISVIPLNQYGSLLPLAQQIQDEGSSRNTERQAGPHVHAVLLSPDQRYLLYSDLGTDEVHCYEYDPKRQTPLTACSKIHIKPGSGPRHLVFANTGKHVYLVTELSADVLVFDFANGGLTHVQTISMLANGFKGEPGGGDITISPDGMFLYATNRGDANEIIVFSIDREDGRLNFLQRCSSIGKSPRNLVIEPAGGHLLVANQDSDSIVVFKIDKANGKIGGVVSIKAAEKPSCLKFLESCKQ
jgi:6-phosphogluconolactonase